jgi:Secretion system C-terminal sorting domain
MQKTLSLLFALLSLSIGVQSQTILIGLNNNQTTGLASVIRWDADTGTMLDSIVTTQPGYVMGSSVYDAVNSNYYFDGSFQICRVGFTPSSFSELNNSGLTFNTEVDMANGKIFSVRGTSLYDSLGTYIGYQTEFVRYNIVDSTEVILGLLPSVAGFYLDANCYNSNSGTYYSLGIDTLGMTVLVSIPTRGTSFSPSYIPISSSANLFTLEYDNEYDILYSLGSDTALSWHLQIQKIDTLTGALTLEADFPQLIGYVMTTTTYDQTNSSMIMMAIDNNQTYYSLYKYATVPNTLDTLIQPNIGEIAELECDNSQYASVKYGSVTAVAADPALPGITLYPNPAHDVLRIATTEPMSELRIIDALGRTTSLPPVSNGAAIDVSTLASGCYYVRAKLDNGLWSQSKFVKQ